MIEKQYYLELYKLGSVSRKGRRRLHYRQYGQQITEVCRRGRGDFHNDLNTQLSYWPAYTESFAGSSIFTDWLWKIRPVSLQYTKQYFGVDGLNVPGVVTLNGDPYGQVDSVFAFSYSKVHGVPSTFYWQWKYSMDDRFLQQKLTLCS